MAAEFSLDFNQSKKFEEALKKFPGDAERKANAVLRKNGKIFIQGIVNFIPISDRSKLHAKNSNPLKIQFMNLGLRVLPKSAFNYLVFPNDGLGRHNLVAQMFFERGGSNASEEMLEILQNALAESAENII